MNKSITSGLPAKEWQTIETQLQYALLQCHQWNRSRSSQLTSPESEYVHIAIFQSDRKRASDDGWGPHPDASSPQKFYWADSGVRSLWFIFWSKGDLLDYCFVIEFEWHANRIKSNMEKDQKCYSHWMPVQLDFDSQMHFLIGWAASITFPLKTTLMDTWTVNNGARCKEKQFVTMMGTRTDSLTDWLDWHGMVSLPYLVRIYYFPKWMSTLLHLFNNLMLIW